MHSFSEFKNPPAAYRPMPFWFWNGRLDVPRLERQIAEMHERGIGGFFIHARFGLETEYMSGEWLECVRASISEAARLGMEVWLYDESNFPSGLSDLKVTARPEFRAKYVDLTEARVEGPCSVELSLPPGRVLAAKAVRCEGDSLTADSLDLTVYIGGGRLSWHAPPGEWQVMVFVHQVLDSPNGKVFGVDYLNPEATRYFIETTHDVYARAVGEHFGGTVKGFFVDEPTLLPWHHDISWYADRKHPRVVVWSQSLASELERHNLPASEVLPHLFYTMDGTSGRKRLAFWQAVNRLYLESFFKPYREWCDDHGLLLTGHLLLEEGLYCNTIFQADPVTPLAHMHVPGTDHLGIGAETPYGGFAHLPRTVTNIQGEKLVTSVAHLVAGDRVLSETFGCSGWRLNLQDMKRITDWQYSLGVNFMCPHAFFYSIEGFRKTDAPPSHNHNACWSYYRRYADYVSRLSCMLSGGSHIAQVGVLYPLEGFQAEYEVGRQGGRDKLVSDGFDALCTVLPRIHHDYDILHDGMLRNSRAESGKLHVGEEAFDVVILPPTASLDSKVAAKLGELRQAGGRVMALASGGIAPCCEAEVLNVDDLSDLEALGGRLRETLGRLVRPDVGIDSGEGVLSSIRCLHRRKDGRDVYFLINTSDVECEAAISLDGDMSLERHDLETGDVSAIECGVEEGRTRVTWSFPPYGSLMLVSGGTEQGGSARGGSRAAAVRQAIELGDEWEFRTERPNCLILGSWSLSMEARDSTEFFRYQTHVELEEVPGSLLLLLDDIEYRNAVVGGMDLTIRVNDREWHDLQFGEYLDPGFKTLDIAPAVRKGANEIALSIGHMCWSGEPKLLTSMPKLLGDFVVLGTSPYKLGRPSGVMRYGSWTDQGYPHYSGTASYGTRFELPSDAAEGAVRLVAADVADMFEALVNGSSAGVRPWQPWTVDVTDLVHPGENELTLKVTNSMQNFLEGVPRASGLLGKVGIEILDREA